MALPDWAPSAGQVAAILRARTRGDESIAAASASEIGTFTDATRPTLTQVTELIEMACGDVAASFMGREPCTDGLRGAAGSAAAYCAAQLVEVSYYPEDTRGEGSAFEALERLASRAMDNVAAAVIERCPFTPGDDTDDGGPLRPVGRMPVRPRPESDPLAPFGGRL